MQEILVEHLKNPKGVGIIVIQNNKVLLGKRKDSGEWALAGGGIEEGETPKQSAIRELQEEFGIVVEDLKYFGVAYSPANPFKSSDSKSGCSVDFFIEFKSDENIDIILEPTEMTEFKWVELDKILKEKLYPSSRTSLELFLRI